MREISVENYLKKQCSKHHIMCHKYISPGKNGVPDRLLAGHRYDDKIPLIIFVELKAPGKKLRPLQVATHNTMRSYGCIIDTADSYDDVNNILHTYFHIPQDIL